MKISDALTDSIILQEIGNRISRQRIELNVTQNSLAESAGVSKRTIERLESGQSTQLVNFLRILRSLKMLSKMEALLPDAKPGPVELLKRRGKLRRRARISKKVATSWEWGDET